MGEKTQKYGKIKADVLSAREIRFCRHYIESNNATQSIQRAGYKFKNENVCSTEAFRLLRLPKIRQFISELRQQAAEVAKIDINRIIQQWSYIAFGDRKTVYRSDGTLKQPSEWDKTVDGIIAEIETIETEDGASVKKVKLERRGEALKELARLIGLGEQKDATHQDNVVDLGHNAKSLATG